MKTTKQQQPKWLISWDDEERDDLLIEACKVLKYTKAFLNMNQPYPYSASQRQLKMIEKLFEKLNKKELESDE